MTDTPTPATNLAHRSYRSRRLRDAALFLPILGIVLYTTPVLRVFTADVTAFGIPLAFVFVYGGWAVLIILGRALAQRLRVTDDG